MDNNIWIWMDSCSPPKPLFLRSLPLRQREPFTTSSSSMETNADVDIQQPPRAASPESYDLKVPAERGTSDPAELPTPAASNPKPPPFDTAPESEADAGALDSVAEHEHGMEQATGEAAIVPRGFGGKRKKMSGAQYSGQLASKSLPTCESKSSSKTKISAKARTSIRKIFWCDVCRVECNHATALESHRNGKLHKKTVRNLEDMQKRLKQLSEYEANCAMDTSSAMVVNKLEPANESQTQAIKQLEMVIKTSEEQQLSTGQSEIESRSTVAADSSAVSLHAPGTILEPQAQRMDGQGISIHASKRKKVVSMSGTCQERSHVKEHPIVCNICNVTCDTQAVFECHLVGRKHMHKVKQFHGGKAMNGSLGYFFQPDLQVSTSNGMPPLFYGFQSHVKEHPIICTICNVTCDTRAVFECHLVGKKHRHRVKQFHGRKSIRGTLGYFPQPQLHGSTSNGVPSLFNGSQSHINPQVPQGHCHPCQEIAPCTSIPIHKKGRVAGGNSPKMLVIVPENLPNLLS